ncbi:hypothetical protein NW768_007366 [Fusarium equiseti]|uniref:Uncharacterized protein n=1 Tax=Fusarium equiseti TaxID=61235 RepID=A0ABQ8R809_FUSEQ|nr:hypothetical protein NW768_007366 [Fusarium equiseti]
MSDADQARLDQAKKSLVAAAKAVQKEKDDAKAQYEEEKEMGMVSENGSLSEWCENDR